MKRCNKCDKMVHMIEVDAENINETKSLIIYACDNCKTPIKLELHHQQQSYERNQTPIELTEPKRPELPFQILSSAINHEAG